MTSFCTVLCHDLNLSPALTGACIGFEDSKWRAQQFARHVFRRLPEFCLSFSERESINATNCVEHLGRAARLVYNTNKYERRGEFGELILHTLLREIKNTEPAISKIFFKDAVNNTVKGFDAVHVVDTGQSLELWIGEVKFYTDIADAIRDVTKELEDHFKVDYLKREFGLISNKLDKSWSCYPRLAALLHENKSLDEVVDSIVVPVLLTYESETVKGHAKTTSEYKKALSTELLKHYKKFAEKNATKHVRIELFLMPLQSKEILITHMHDHLQHMQAL